MPACPHCNQSAPLGPASLNKQNTGFRKALWIALLINLTLFLVEILFAWETGSMALLADSTDFFADAVNYAVSLFVIGMALRVRAKVALAKGLVMLLLGLLVLCSSLFNAFKGGLPDSETVAWVAAMALLANLTAGLVLFRFRNSDSNALSVWLCTRNDAIGNVTVIASAALVATTQTPWPDLLIAALLAALAIHSGLRIIRLASLEMRLTNKES